MSLLHCWRKKKQVQLTGPPNVSFPTLLAAIVTWMVYRFVIILMVEIDGLPRGPRAWFFGSRTKNQLEDG
jgi:hypothetical protein